MIFGLFNNPVSASTPIELESSFVIEHGGNLELVNIGFKDRMTPLSPLRVVKANHRYFYVLPDVVVPSLFSIFLLENIKINPDEEVLDIGSGSGILSIFAADTAKRVVATDLSYSARENTRMNAKLHEVDHIIDSRQGDLFSSIGNNEMFDVILLSIAFPAVNGSKELWELHTRFFKEVGQYLKENGRIYYIFGFYENLPQLIPLIVENGFRVMLLNNYKATQTPAEPMVLTIQRRIAIQ